VTDDRLPGRVAVLSGTWGRRHDEVAFATRAVASAISRLVPADVLVPGPPGTTCPDGAFDLVPVGGTAGGPDTGGRWPAPEDAEWPTAGPHSLAVVDDADVAALALARRFLPEVPMATLVSSVWEGPAGNGHRGRAQGPVLAVGVGSTPAGAYEVGLHVPVHALAAVERHVGLGFTDYVLVLSDRGPGAAADATPTSLVAWLVARFADRHVVVVENAVASVWRARSLRGVVGVNTRTDLWRLVAHARMTVDLAPGPLMARECVESLHYGVPIVVPAGTAAACLAGRGGGLWFANQAELFGCIEALDEQRVRDMLGAQGKAVAREWYGDADRFVKRIGTALETARRSPSP
jgi:hypothetical protein